MVRAIIFASALMIGSVAMAQDAPPADTPPAATDATPPAADAAAAPATTDASYPACSAKVQDHCIQGAHKTASHKMAKRRHHK